jgi:beta-phosphoglucomutase-like phosphatase (HAD superfamily)
VGSGLLTALVTGSSRQTTEIFLKELQGIHSFDVIVTGESVQNGKPSPDPYLFAARQLSVPPSSCWILEDSEAGLRSAVAAGAVPVHLASGQHGGEHCGDHEMVVPCVHTLTEFIELAVQARCGSRELQR